MATEPILKVPVDDSEVTALIEKVKELHELLSRRQQLNVNGAFNGKPANGANSGGGNGRNAFTAKPEAGSWPKEIEKLARDPHVTGRQSFSAQFKQNSVLAALQWRHIAKDVQGVQKNFSQMARTLVSFRSLGGLALGGGAVGAAMGAAAGAASDIAGRSLEAKKLGLKFGQADAFEDTYGPALGIGKGELSAVASAQGDQNQWKKFQALNIGVDEIQHKNPVQLEQEIVQRAGQQYKANPAGYGMWAKATGVSDFADVNTARAASTMSDSDFQNLAAKNDALAKKLELSADAQQKATDATIKFKSAIDAAATNLEGAFTPLIDQAADLAKAWGDDLAQFARLDELKSDIDELVGSFKSLKKAGDWLADELNKIIPHTVDPDQKHDVHLKKDSVAANAVRFWDNPSGTWKEWRAGTLPPAPAVDYDWMWNNQQTDSTTTSSPEGSSLAAQNNNPANLRRWKNTPAGAGGFAKFRSANDGLNAAADNLRAYGKQGINTLRGIISKWAPASENDTQSYIEQAVKATGFKPDQHLDLNDPTTLAKVESAVVQRESPDFKYATPGYLQNLLAGGGAGSALDAGKNVIPRGDKSQSQVGSATNDLAGALRENTVALRENTVAAKGGGRGWTGAGAGQGAGTGTAPGANTYATTSALPQ